MTRLRGKVALVTGAGASGRGVGTGQAIARLFAREGARMAIVDLDGGRAEATLQEVREDGGEGLALVADVTSEEDCERVVAETVEHLGRLDVLVNNVGKSGAGGNPLDLEVWRHLLDVNLTGAMLVCKHAIPRIAEMGGGSIVNISSTAATLGGSGSAYGAAKAGLINFTRGIALKHGRDGIRANIVAPGPIWTPHVAAFISDEERELRRISTPLGIEGDAWDVALAALYFASDESRYVTGVCLPVDGGLTQTQVLPGYRLIQSATE